MALQADLQKTIVFTATEPDGSVLSETKERVYQKAYIVVSQVRSTKTQCVATVDAYKTSEKTESEKIWRRMYSFTPSVSNNSQNFIRQAYIYLKTLPEYSNAEDC